MSFLLELPQLPRELNPNYRGHWTGRYKASVQAKHDAFYAAKEIQLQHFNYLQIRVHIYAPNNNVPDPDNALAMAKPYIDGLVLAGVIDNDTKDQVEYLPIQYHIAAGEKHRTVFEVNPKPVEIEDPT